MNNAKTFEMELNRSNEYLANIIAAITGKSVEEVIAFAFSLKKPVVSN